MKKLVIFLIMFMAMATTAMADTYLVRGSIIHGRMYLPIAKFRDLGLKVTWQPKARAVVLETENEKLTITEEYGLKLISGKAHAPVRHLNVLKDVKVVYDHSVKGCRVTVNSQTQEESVVKIDTDRPVERIDNTRHDDKVVRRNDDTTRRDDYRDNSRYNSRYNRANDHFSSHQVEKYGMDAYSDSQLAKVRINAKFRQLAGGESVRIGEAIDVMAELLGMTPSQFEATLMVKGLVDDQGYIDRHRSITYADLNQLVCAYFEYMGVDPFAMPAHKSAYLEIRNENSLSQAEIYYFSALKWVGIDATGDINYRRGEITARQGEVDVAVFNDLMRQLTLD